MSARAWEARPLWDSHAARSLRWIAVVVLLAPAIWFGLNLSWPHPDRQQDLWSFVGAGRAAATGLDPYGRYSLPVGATAVLAPPNLNPPLSIVFFQPLAAIAPEAAPWVWYGLSIGVYLATLLVLARAYPEHQPWQRLGWALILAAPWFTLMMGQIYLFLLALAAGAWLLLRAQRPILAGVLIGLLVAIKPQFVVWPLLLLAAGHAVAGLAALVAAALVSLLPALLYGPGIYSQWLAWSDGVPLGSLWNVSLTAAVARLVPASLAGIVGPALGVLLLVALALDVRRRRASVGAVSELAVLLTLLISPVTWLAYTVLLVPVVFARRNWGPALLAAVVLLSLPVAEAFNQALATLATSPVAGASDVAVVASVLPTLLLLVLLADTTRALRTGAGAPVATAAPAPPAP
jgi:hypothetical protein